MKSLSKSIGAGVKERQMKNKVRCLVAVVERERRWVDVKKCQKAARSIAADQLTYKI
jgi:hypothetical protein